MLFSYINHFCHTVPILFNGDFHGYYTRSRNNIRKSTANRKWGYWSSINSSSEIWNRLDPLTAPTFNSGIYIFSFLVSIIRFLLVLGNFLEDPSVNHFCDVGFLIKDCPQRRLNLQPLEPEVQAKNAPLLTDANTLSCSLTVKNEPYRH